MNNEIQQIRVLLDKMEQSSKGEEEKTIKESFNYLELPELISSIVDYLQPLLSPYEVSIFWFLFRHSIVEKGDVNLRVSNTLIGKSIGSKFKGSDSKKSLCDKTVQDNLRSLEEKGVIKKAGDTNRDGTLYRIYLPEEIEICRNRMKESQTTETANVNFEKEADFYNIKENILKVFERDGYRCYKCDKLLTRFSATLDHIEPVSKGGDNSLDNLRTACLHCNSQRGNKPLQEFLEKE